MTRSNSDGSWSLEPDDLFGLLALLALVHVGAYKLVAYAAELARTDLSERALYVLTAIALWPGLFRLGQVLGLWCNPNSGFRWFPR